MARKKLINIKWERVIGLIILVTVAVFFWKHIMFVSSVEAFISADIRNIRSPIFGQLKMHDFKPGKTFIQQNVLFEVYNSRVGDLGIFGDYHNFQHRIDLVEMDIVQNGISIKKYEDDLQRNQRLQEIGGVAKEVVNDIRYALDSLRSELQNKED